MTTAGLSGTSLVLRRARVHTMQPGQSPMSAVAVRDGRVVAVGGDQYVWSAVGADSPAVDLGGRCVLPGFTDAHLHWCTHALIRRQLALTPTLNLSEVQRLVRLRAADLPPGTWIIGRGWSQARWPRWPNTTDLDAATSNHPVALTRVDGHAVWLNTRAMQLAGVGTNTPDPPGGEIERMGGAPTGILKENALRLVNEVVPEPGPAERQAAMVDAWPDAWCLGITGAHDMGFRETALFRDLSTLRESGELGLRFVWYFPHGMLEEAIGLGLASGLGDEWLRVGGLKLFLDGSLGSQSARMLAPFEGQPANFGIAAMSEDRFSGLISQAAGAGIATAVHAIGDAANRTALDGFERLEAARAPSQRRLRHRIEHAQLLDPADVGRFATLGVVASMQPIHATSDMATADRWWGSRASGAYAWRSLAASGARLAFGSDAPIETLDPLAGVHAAVTRQTAQGDPPDGWYPEQTLTAMRAVDAYTLGPAFASGQDDGLGSLAVGKAADMIVLDADPTAVAPEEIPRIRVLATMIEGVWVWQAPSVDFGGPRHTA